MQHFLAPLALALVAASSASAAVTAQRYLVNNNEQAAPGFCLAFEDDFNKLDFNKWKHDVTLGGGGNWEFEWYSNNRTNSYVRDGVLYLRPTLTADNIGEDKVRNGYTMDIWGTNSDDFSCTGNGFYGCSRSSNGVNLINPIQSAMLRSSRSFSFKYGRVEVKAKLPRGDWIWPAIWMLPKNPTYGNWPASGEIDIMESRGNDPSYIANGVPAGVDTYSSALHWGPSYEFNQFPKTTASYKNPSGPLSDDFHVYGMEWTPEGIKTYIDSPENVVLNVPFGQQTFWEKSGLGTLVDNPWVGAETEHAPFDHEFYLLMNVAVGGVSGFFPDGSPGKPWSDKSDRAALEFWNAKGAWYNSWKGEDVALKIDSVRVWNLC